MYREARLGASVSVPPMRSAETSRAREPLGRSEGGARPAVDPVDVRELAGLLARAGKLSVAQSVDLLMPVISALAAAHDAGVHDELEHEGARGGQFALGAVLYECLTGRPPFQANDSHGTGIYRRPRDIAPHLPRGLEAIILRAVREDPRDRFGSMRDFGAGLLPYASRPVQLSHVAEFGPSITSRRGAPSARTRGPRSRSDQSKLRAAYHRAAASMTKGARGRSWMAWALAAAVGALLVALTPHPKKEARTETAASAERSAPLAAGAKRAESSSSTSPAAQAPDAVRAGTERATSSGAYQVDLSVEPRGAWIMLDRKAAGSGRLRRSFRVDGRVHEVRVGAPGYKVRSLYFKDAPPPGALVLERRGK